MAIAARTYLSYRAVTCPRATQPIAPCRSQSLDGVHRGIYSLTSAARLCSGCVHVRRGQHPFPTTEPSRSGGLLGLVRKLIEYAAARHHDPAACLHRTRLRHLPLRHHPGGTDPRLHLPRPASRRGARGQDRPQRRPSRRTAPGRRACAPAARAEVGRRAVAQEADPHLARLPTPAEIAAEVRRRPIGAVLADICRDLGIMPSDPLWRELQRAIIRKTATSAAW